MPAFLHFGFPEDIIQALSWTLIHSLWQGMLLAVIAGAVIFFTKKASPSIRYNLLTGLLLIFVVGVSVTFSSQLMNYSADTPLMQKIPAATEDTVPADWVQAATVNQSRVKNSVVDIFNANASWIVLAWLLVTLIQCLRLTAGLYNVYQLKRKQTFSAGEYWNERIIELCRHLKIRKNVALLQSGISLPSVIGFFKPVILFPAGMLASLPQAEVEVILIHELAHIRRKDFAVNILQHILDIIFFFNPAVRWVSYLVRSERENCCDEIAVSQTDNKREYINALMAFQAPGLALTPLASSFAAEKNHLINRVKRIIYNQNRTLNNMEKKFLAAGMIITCAGIFAFSSNTRQHLPVKTFNTVQTQDMAVVTQDRPHSTVAIDTVPVNTAGKEALSNGTFNSTVNGKKYKIIVEDDVVTQLYINGRKVPNSKLPEYKAVTGKILKQAKVDMKLSQIDLEQSKKELEESQKELEAARLEMEQSHEEMSREMEQAKKEMEEQKSGMTRDMEESKKELEKEQAEMKLEMDKLALEQSNKKDYQSKKEMEQAMLEMKKAMREIEMNKKKMDEDMRRAKIEMEQANQNIIQSKKDMEESMRAMEKSHKDMVESKKVQENFVTDLINEKIIQSKDDLSSYKLSNQELIVNGVKQPAAVHKKFKDRYIKADNRTIMFNYNGNNDVK